MTPQTFIFIGRSGCGKGTQAALLQKKLEEKDPENKVFYLETGQEFRDFTSAEGYSNNLAKKIQEEGGLQPAFLSVWIWSSIFIKNIDDKKHLIIDGSLRRLGEAIIFSEAMRFYSRKPTIVYLNVTRKWSEVRLGERHRSDDALAMVKKRLDWFDTEVMPAVQYFETNLDVNFLDIDAENTIEVVHQKIVEKLGW